MGIDNVSLSLTALSGLCWTIVYIDAIRLGFRDKTYAMPLWALALNFSWELINSVLGYREVGLSLQVFINMVWAIFDTFIVLTYFLFGYRYIKKYLSYEYFMYWGFIVFSVAFVVQYAFIMQFGLPHGRAYAAFLQNLLMSILFISMRVERQNNEGQSLTIAVGKCVGTFAPTILFGLIGAGGLGRPNPFLLIIGLLCFGFDIIYILILINKIELVKRCEERPRPV